MRKIVDSNFLRSSELRSYLTASQQNMAVLTDYAAMEAYKGDTLVSIYNSMSILSEFPTQVLVLKSTLVTCGLSGREAGLQKRFIDAHQTKGFGIYCRNLEAAKAGNVALQRQLLELGREAMQHLDERMLSDAGTFPSAVEHIAATYTKEELVALRTAAPYSDEMIKKLIMCVLHAALEMFRSHPRVQKLPHRNEMPNTFIFHAALYAYLLALDWIAVAGAQGAKGVNVKNIRNDMVDVNFAAYGTFFDDLLSCDGKTQRIYGKARLVLARVFGCQVSGLTKDQKYRSRIIS